MGNELTPIQQTELQKKLTPNEISHLASFVDIQQMLNILKEKKWSGDSELTELVAVANQNENLGAKITAIKYLRSIIYDGLQAAGLMVKATRNLRGEDGSTLTLTSALINTALQSDERTENLKGKTKDDRGHTQENKQKEGASIHKPPREDGRKMLPGISIPS